ncbi:MAG: DnaJ domain-containing protein [Chloroflexi bacterium]|nr:DnaJ domain-containing protein [Chloroflexota bacterium]
MPAGPTFDPYAILQVVPTAEHEVIQGAYKALAFKYHPDRDPSRRAAEKMADLNRAFALLRDPAGRAQYDRTRKTVIAGVNVADYVRPTNAPSRPTAGSSVLNFGRYAGWAIADIARRDPDYVLWLSRHSSGIRYRTEIYSLLRTMGVSAA